MASGRPIRSSIRVLRDNRRLVLLPVLSGTGLLLLAGLMLLAFGLQSGSGLSLSGGGTVLMAVGYLVLSCAATFFACVLICAVDDAMGGRRVAIRAGYVRVLRRLPLVAAWGLLNATLVPVASMLQEVPVAGWVLAAILGDGWGFATYLVLPAMMIDGLGIPAALRRSFEIFRRRGGVQIRSTVWFVVMVVLSGVTVLVPVMIGVESNDRTAMIGALAVSSLLLVSLLVVSSTVFGIFRTVLYRQGVAQIGPVRAGEPAP